MKKILVAFLHMAMVGIMTGSCVSVGHSWGYAGNTGPDKWGSLNPDFSLCDEGKVQSPVDIATASVEDVPGVRLSWDYGDTPIHVVNNGHTVLFEYAPGSFLHAGDDKYQLAQFHFHSPGEHTVDGGSFPLELHLVHKNEAGDFAVLGVLFEKGESNAFLERIWREIPQESEGMKTLEGTINAADVLPSDATYYSYPGSLTTPPCSENVSWFLLAKTAGMSGEQLGRFNEFYNGNNRPVRLNGAKWVVGDLCILRLRQRVERTGCKAVSLKF